MISDELIIGFTIFFLFLAVGIFYEGFWMFAALISFIIVEPMNVQFPNTLWSLSMVAFGIILIIVSLSQMMNKGDERR